MTRTQNIGIRMLCVALSLVCLLSGVQPVMAAEEPAAAASDTIDTTLVRNSASYYAAVIGQMENGTAVTVLDARGDFYKIDCYDMNGYIAKEQIVQKDDGKYYVNCDPASSETSTMAGVSLADVLLLRASVLALTQDQLGYPYVYGGSAPGGFDCSGLTSYIYKKHDYAIHRTASDQLQDGLIVSREGLQVGDLIFFRDPGYPYLSSHVGIYAGDNQIIHAGSRGICYADLDTTWFASRYLCARRMVTVSAQAIDPTPIAVAESAAAYIPSAGIRTAR